MDKLDIVDIDIMTVIVNRELEKTTSKKYFRNLMLLKEKLERTRRKENEEKLDIEEIGFITILVDNRLTELEKGKPKSLSEQFYFELRMLRRKLRVIIREDVRQNACNV